MVVGKDWVRQFSLVCTTFIISGSHKKYENWNVPESSVHWELLLRGHSNAWWGNGCKGEKVDQEMLAVESVGLCWVVIPPPPLLLAPLTIVLVTAATTHNCSAVHSPIREYDRDPSLCVFVITTVALLQYSFSLLLLLTAQEWSLSETTLYYLSIPEILKQTWPEIWNNVW